MNTKQSNELIFYFPALEQLTPHLSPGIPALFCYHWERILKNVAFAGSPYRQERIDQLKDSHFWYSLIKELLHDDRYEISQISQRVGAPPDFIRKIHWDKPDKVNMPLSVGEKLLRLHQEIRPDLQKTG